MSFHGLTLVVPDKDDPERDAVVAAWREGGGEVLRLGRFWDPPPLDAEFVRLYGNDAFCLVLEQKLGLRLVSPPDDLPAAVDRAWTRRRVTARTLAEALEVGFPAFVKPLAPKVFRAAVYASADGLREECAGLPDETPVLVSEVVDFRAEARAWVLDGGVAACAVYEGAAPADEAAAFVADFVRDHAALLPRTLVVDAGRLPGGEWALVEANAAWGAGLNGCDARAAAACIAHATEPAGGSG